MALKILLADLALARAERCIRAAERYDRLSDEYLDRAKWWAAARDWLAGGRKEPFAQVLRRRRFMARGKRT